MAFSTTLDQFRPDTCINAVNYVGYNFANWAPPVVAGAVNLTTFDPFQESAEMPWRHGDNGVLLMFLSDFCLVYFKFMTSVYQGPYQIQNQASI